jgi:hypothetical protein
LPFTFAHPAAVLPFKRFGPNYFSYTGLFIGSLVPDFEYFIRFNDSMHWSHFWWGIFCFDLPVGLFLCFLFHNIVRSTLLPQLPSFMYRRLAVCKHFKWNRYFAKNWLTVIISVLLASALHILWDELIHFSADAVLKTGIFPGMDTSLRDILIYYSIWSLNSLLGLIALAAWFYSLPGTPVYLPEPGRSKYWILTAVTAFSVISIRLMINSKLSVIDLTDTCISATFIGLILSSIIGQAQVYRKKSSGQRNHQMASQ